VGLSAVASEGADGWHLTVGSALFAQWVSLYLPGVTAADSWFHLAPGGSRTVALSGRPSRGSVRALNATHGVTVTYA
jgi:beta-mannosidase